MKIKSIKKIKVEECDSFCDITTGTGNFVLAKSNCVVHNSHITSLLMVIFLKLTPQLLKKGIIYRAIMPLYGAMVQKRFIPFYTEEDLNKFKENNPNVKIQRYKGLGEMNPDQLKVCLLDKETRRLEKIDYPENAEEIFQLMISAELKRGLINDE